MNKNVLLFGLVSITTGVAWGSQRTTPEMFLPEAAELSRDLTAAQSLWDIARTPVPEEEQTDSIDDSGMDDSDTESSIISLPDISVVRTSNNPLLLQAVSRKMAPEKEFELLKKIAQDASDPFAQAEAWYSLGEHYYFGISVGPIPKLV